MVPGKFSFRKNRFLGEIESAEFRILKSDRTSKNNSVIQRGGKLGAQRTCNTFGRGATWRSNYAIAPGGPAPPRRLHRRDGEKRETQSVYQSALEPEDHAKLRKRIYALHCKLSAQKPSLQPNPSRLFLFDAQFAPPPRLTYAESARFCLR